MLEIDEALTTLSKTPVIGNGNHTTTETGAYDTHNWVMDMCEIHPNPCSTRKEASSGCANIQGVHTVTSQADITGGVEGEPVLLCLDEIATLLVPEELPTQTRAYTNETTDVDFTINSWQHDDDGKVTGCKSTPACIGGPHQSEHSCGLKFFPSKMSGDNCLPFNSGTYEYTNNDGSEHWTVAIGIN